MSIALNVYAKGALLTRELLAQECQSPDLPEPLRWQIVFLNVHDLLPADQNGPLLDDQSVAGWPATSEHAPEIRAALANSDKPALQRLFEAEAFGTTDLFLTRRDSDEWGEISDPEYLEAIPEEHHASISDATCRYSLETHASRNETSLEFQQHLWHMIGVLTYGLLEDPQEGEFEDCSGDEGRA